MDVVLDNGDGTVTGPFDYDAMTNTFTNVNVTAVGAAFPASSASLTSILPDFSGAVTIDFVPSLADITGAQDVYISLASPMTGTRETIGVSDVYMYICLNSDCSDYDDTQWGSGVPLTGTISSVSPGGSSIMTWTVCQACSPMFSS